MYLTKTLEMKDSGTKHRAFSLLETIIYIGLLSMILVAIVNMLLSMSKAYGYLKLSRHIQTSAITALDRIVREIRNAESVNIPESTLGTNPGILTLNTSTSSGNPQVFQFHILSGVLRMKQDNADLGPLTLSDVSVTNLVFRHMDTGISEAVKIEMTLNAGTHTKNFYATALLRDSY